MSTLRLLSLLLSLLAVSAHVLPGHRRHSHRTSSGCTPCLPEWGVLHMCNSTHQTVCKPCPPGTWTPRHSHLLQCQSCARCGPGLYIEQPCSPTQDTKCDWCSTSKGRFNVDFIKKCLDRRDVPADEQSEALKTFYEEEEKMEKSGQNRPQDGDPHHLLWQPIDVNHEKKSREMDQEIVFKPSYHEYDIEAAIRAHRRKVYVLLGLAGVMIIATLIFGLCFLREYFCGRQIRAHQQRLYVHLSEQDHHIIHDCAKRLGNGEKEEKQKPSCEEWWEDDPMNITENPLESRLPSLPRQNHNAQQPSSL